MKIEYTFQRIQDKLTNNLHEFICISSNLYKGVKHFNSISSNFISTSVWVYKCWY